MNKFKLILLALLSFGLMGCGNPGYGPTSIAGVTPGKTTLEELRLLVKDPLKVEGDYHIVGLKGLDNKMAYISSRNSIVYEVDINLMFESEILDALISKYGKPIRKTGEIKKVVCQNKLGGNFDRVEGEMIEYWREKDGIQATIVHRAGTCAEESFASYVIYDKKIKSEVEQEIILERLKKFGDKIEKINKGI